ncbi:basic salivary proline-rich protein 2-like [Equus caballus]|uniref:basic salivary proline-rich protein 2-like n=1 Tax=Equus caballus TaxID=9796 RepID=UPI0038B29B76
MHFSSATPTGGILARTARHAKTVPAISAASPPVPLKLPLGPRTHAGPVREPLPFSTSHPANDPRKPESSVKWTAGLASNPFPSSAKLESGLPASTGASPGDDPTCATGSTKCIHRPLNIATAPDRYRPPTSLAAWTLSSTCSGHQELQGPRDGCTDPQGPPRPLPKSSAFKLGQLSKPTSGLPPQDRASLPPSYGGDGSELNRAGAVVRQTRSSRCARQPNNHAKNPPRTLASAGDPRFYQALPPWSSSPGAPGQGEPATRPLPPQCPPRARRDQSREQRRSALGTPPPPRGLAGGGGEPGGGERQREEGDGGARSRSATQITAQPAGRSAGSCGCSELPPPPLLLAASRLPAPHHRRRRRTAKPLSRVSPSRFSRAVSSSQTASEKGEGERSLGVQDD